jgi:hypothetical protein
MSDEKSNPNSAVEDTKPGHIPDIVVVPDGYGADEPLSVLGMARDPLERLLLEQANWFHYQADDYRCLLLGPQRPIDEYACAEKMMRCSAAFLKVYEAFRKYRDRGEQKMIVEHRSAAAERPKRDLRRTAPPTNAKRNDGKARAG